MEKKNDTEYILDSLRDIISKFEEMRKISYEEKLLIAIMHLYDLLLNSLASLNKKKVN